MILPGEDETRNSTGIGKLVSNTVSGFNSTPPAANVSDTPYSNPLGLKSSVSPTSAAEEATSASTDLEPEPENKWASQMQLQVFRETASKIADEYLKECDIKLGKGRRGGLNVIRDRDAYDQGVKDSKKIDLQRKKITEAANSDV